MDVVSVNTIKRFDVYLICLDPTGGTEIKKTRPCVIISPDEMNDMLKTVIIAPVTSTTRKYPTRVKSKINDRSSEIILDQIRSVDKIRLVKKIGKISSASTKQKICDILLEMFAL